MKSQASEADQALGSSSRIQCSAIIPLVSAPDVLISFLIRIGGLRNPIVDRTVESAFLVRSALEHIVGPGHKGRDCRLRCRYGPRIGAECTVWRGEKKILIHCRVGLIVVKEKRDVCGTCAETSDAIMND